MGKFRLLFGVCVLPYLSGPYCGTDPLLKGDPPFGNNKPLHSLAVIESTCDLYVDNTPLINTAIFQYFSKSNVFTPSQAANPCYVEPPKRNGGIICIWAASGEEKKKPAYFAGYCGIKF